MPNSSAADWDEGHPLITDPRRDGAAEILNLRKAVRARADKEHVAYDDVTVGGEHKAGSAVSYIQAGAPTLRPDGTTSLDSTDAGRLWVDTDNDVIKYWDGNSWEDLSALATPSGNFQFEVVDGGASPTLPLQETGCTPGTYIVWVEGTTIDGSGDDAVTVSVTVNAIVRTCVIDNVPDGTAPFSIALHVTVAGDGLCTLTAASNVQRIMKMHGFCTVEA